MTRSLTPPATLAGGRYVLGDVIGEGGTAAVVRATDTVLRVERAIKLLVRTNPELRATLQRRLQAEARAMARLRHPNVLTVHDVGQEGDLDYIVMDLADGGSVADVLERDGYVPVQDAIQMIVQVLSALGAAHAAGVVHRDVKPHNLLLDRSGRVLLADFGIALVTGDDRRTRAGVALGSIAYMPHEQRVDAAAVGPEADLYAVGATLYHLVTGANPVDLFLCADDPDHPRWSPLPPALRPVIRRACAARPEDRYPSALALSNDLMRLLDHTSDWTVPERVIPDVPRTPTVVLDAGPERRFPWAALAAGLALLGAAAAGWFALPAPTVAPAAPTPAPVPAPEPVPEPVPAPDPVPAPAPDPAPVLVAPERPVPAPRRVPPFVRWSGSLNGVAIHLDLRGRPDAVTGSIRSELSSKVDARPVVGRYDPETGALTLEETGPDPARYAFTLRDDRLEGTIEHRGATQTASLYRETR